MTAIDRKKANFICSECGTEIPMRKTVSFSPNHKVTCSKCRSQFVVKYPNKFYWWGMLPPIIILMPPITARFFVSQENMMPWYIGSVVAGLVVGVSLAILSMKQTARLEKIGKSKTYTKR